MMYCRRGEERRTVCSQETKTQSNDGEIDEHGKPGSIHYHSLESIIELGSASAWPLIIFGNQSSKVDSLPHGIDSPEKAEVQSLSEFHPDEECKTDDNKCS